jgi:UrcA family protein
MTVRFADPDLAKPQDVEVLYGRIRRRAGAVSTANEGAEISRSVHQREGVDDWRSMFVSRALLFPLPM